MGFLEEFDKQFGKMDDVISNWDEYTYYQGAEEGWKAALEHFNGLFLDSMHPQDVVFAMQRELEDE